MPSKLRIDVYFDLICPWCLIGKRNLGSALERLRRQRPELEVKVRWRAAPLLPATPLDGVPYQAFYEHRLGTPEAVEARRTEVREAGRRAGVSFAFDNIRTLPNTLAAHALIASIGQAESRGDAGATERLIEALFVAYFQDGRDIGDVEVLLAIAGECAVPTNLQALAAMLPPSEDGYQGLVSGVPFYVFNDSRTLSGAQPPEVLLESMLRSVDQVVA